MPEFICGQRWISDTEADLGLGLVVETELRRVTILFPACDDTRIYATDNAPLTRVRFQEGDEIHSHEGWSLTVTLVEEHEGLLTYLGEKADGMPGFLTELQLSHFIQFSKPQDRLFAGQIDNQNWFGLRHATLEKYNVLAQSPVRGLLGARVSLLPHQLYISHEVASRHAPRVLLADEVGLGKTIEAGLILHQQLFTERARRVLLLTPETLVHQWLVEMLRRFNLNFSVFDEERCIASSNEGEDEEAHNPFHSEQRILCSLEFLLDNPKRLAQAVDGEWDLLVVDEAHHLAWSEQEVSPEYQAVEQLASNTRGLLLLTATPEQLGRTGHFARLRLLDPARFYDYAAFVEEDRHYEPVAAAVQHLLNDEPLPQQASQVLLEKLHESAHMDWLAQFNDPKTDAKKRQQVSRQLLDLLLDRHGTGRVLFRNTRAAVKGFPERKLHAHPLEADDSYRLPEDYDGEPEDRILQELYPEFQNGQEGIWWQQDPRVSWLIDLLNDLSEEKVLVICAHPRTALELEEVLAAKNGIRATVFHEGMTIIQRDRAAAYFADLEAGARVLVSSEIGSEGRNFQFAHHLVLFDLPLNPDLLEQRIGRLDRIGQQQQIQIHVPHIMNSAQESLFLWYHEGMEAFTQTCPACPSVYTRMRPALLEVLASSSESHYQDILEALLEETQAQHAQLRAHLQCGRDLLLEMNSHRPKQAQQLCETIEDWDQDSQLMPWLEQLCDVYGIRLEEQDGETWVLRPGNHMVSASLPELPEDGLKVTLERDTALVREDLQLLSWEHPLVRGGMDWVLSSDQGNTSVVAIRDNRLPSGTLLLETLFVLVCAAPPELQARRFLPATVLRLVLDLEGEQWQSLLSPADIRQQIQQKKPVNVHTARNLVRAANERIQTLVKNAITQANTQLPDLITRSLEQMDKELNAEITRLEALHQVNPNVRPEEIDFARSRQQTLRTHLQASQLNLDALRVIVNT
ncbi:RNA polymerase-associated protein RapA [Candidatus Venteria ishoeyi]|uniref:RNA polymerase-associated protein RapA n=1 Tax=Candidatus Venteria ishoeyi TaxID=1899563 RepID=UPI0025A57CD7|nr:RNA polymerase-associated protein RapA [Candidatus Venteria ishoeyi]MDM8547167.1 RNA polymerase-associated protein RapA [Candidatus Venteria ishoeyi]